MPALATRYMRSLSPEVDSLEVDRLCTVDNTLSSVSANASTVKAASVKTAVRASSSSSPAAKKRCSAVLQPTISLVAATTASLKSRAPGT